MADNATPHRVAVDDGDLTLYHGDALDVLRSLPAGAAQTCVTSPPYWGLRDYGTGTWTGGEPDCQHRVGGQVQDTKAPGAITTGQRPGVDASRCRDCGARRVDHQLGLEATPAEYVANMVAVFREVRRVLRDDGTLWLNLGDSFYSSTATQGRNEDKSVGDGLTGGTRKLRDGGSATYRRDVQGLKPKDLVGIPWRVAFALQADGWYLRSDIIWSKPNPMPESVTDRPTKAHEYVFLFSKRPRYFYDADAIRETAVEGTDLGLLRGRASGPDAKVAWHAQSIRDRQANGVDSRTANPTGRRNRRSVWEIATEPFPEAHFATYPQALVEPCVKAGSREGDVVLDPFVGSGTTALVARRLGRRCVGIDLSAEYLAIAAKRTQQLSLLGGVA